MTVHPRPAPAARVAPIAQFLLLPPFAFLFAVLLVTSAAGQSPDATRQSPDASRKAPPPFRWVNPLKATYPGVKHATLRSPSMEIPVGYCVYLPPGYDESDASERRYPVVYYLHGGRPGDETKSVRLANHLHEAMTAGHVPPMIYVFVNGGPVSHYNMPDRDDAQGEDVFIRELIPHVDATYRTIADRSGRGIEGFSQGGRGTTRIMFRHPDLFCSAAPGGSGYGHEKRISEEYGRESERLTFAPGDNAWDLARRYAMKPQPKLNILVYVGTKCFNYENNLEYMTFLESLEIPFRRLIVPDVPHNAKQTYDAVGTELMRFHAKNFGLPH